MGSGVHMGKEAKEKHFVKIILDVGHKTDAKWDEKLSREAVSEPWRQPLHQEGSYKRQGSPLEEYQVGI